MKASDIMKRVRHGSRHLSRAVSSPPRKPQKANLALSSRNLTPYHRFPNLPTPSPTAGENLQRPGATTLGRRELNVDGVYRMRN